MKRFFNMIRPCFWKEADEKDLMAIMKRSVIIVNSKKFVYVRRATEREVRVPLIPPRDPHVHEG